MDSNKIALIIGGLLLAGFIALPLLNPQPPATPAGSASSGAAGGAASAAAAGPNLTQAELIGSTWQATVPKAGQIHVRFNGDGTFTAAPTSMMTAQMLRTATGTDQIAGTWMLSGTDLQLNAQAGNQAINVKGQIKGQTIEVDGKVATRVQ